MLRTCGLDRQASILASSTACSASYTAISRSEAPPSSIWDTPAATLASCWSSAASSLAFHRRSSAAAIFSCTHKDSESFADTSRTLRQYAPQAWTTLAWTTLEHLAPLQVAPLQVAPLQVCPRNACAQRDAL